MSMAREPSIDECEWQAQERGMHVVLDARPEDSMTQHYRVVAYALQSTPRSQPPDSFASTVAQLAVTRSNAKLEYILFEILLIIFAISLLVVLALYSGRLLLSLNQAFGSDAFAWLLAGMGCLAVSWIFGQLHCLDFRITSSATN